MTQWQRFSEETKSEFIYPGICYLRYLKSRVTSILILANNVTYFQFHFLLLVWFYSMG